MSEAVTYLSPTGELLVEASGDSGAAAGGLPTAGGIDLPGGISVSRDELLAAYRQVRAVRHFDERAVTLQRQGRFGVYPPFRGQEAAQVGTAAALGPTDWLVPTYRETAAALTHGLPASTAILYWRAHPAGWDYPEGLRLLPFYVPIATQLTHAVGLAHAGTLRGDDSVAMVYVGDGGSSEGDFHEALNFASVYRSPVVFVVQNNGWAISVPTARQMGNTRIADRAAGYGIHGLRVDGNDLLAVLVGAQEAVARARAGEGPTLIEAVTYRLTPHTTSDDASRYRDEDETRRREELEPLIRLNRYLRRNEWWTDSDEETLLAELDQNFSAALAEADAQPLPAPRTIVEHVFETMTPAQREAWEALS